MGPPAQEDPYLPKVRLANWLARPLVVSWAVKFCDELSYMIHPRSLTYTLKIGHPKRKPVFQLPTIHFQVRLQLVSGVALEK